MATTSYPWVRVPVAARPAPAGARHTDPHVHTVGPDKIASQIRCPVIIFGTRSTFTRRSCGRRWIRSSRARGRLPVARGFRPVEQSGYEVSPSQFRAGDRRCLGLPTRCGLHFRGAETHTPAAERKKTAPGTAVHHLQPGPPRRSDDAVQVVEMPAQRVAAVRHTGAYWRVGMAFEELAKRCAALGLPAGPSVAVFYDDSESVPEEELRSIAGLLSTPGRTWATSRRRGCRPGGTSSPSTSATRPGCRRRGSGCTASTSRPAAIPCATPPPSRSTAAGTTPTRTRCAPELYALP